ncbi:Ubiquitin carboxyl-terminal hydrolase family protein [Hondaea fermentalgiana]|uniref:Ubiquitin carboxyl-terminal hydrolase n=1 Tax=Hondaea fermentalgiana TaxID=2315210 RepID=A0A2R5GQ48_9STRA|nr:Ubiquitin carboxyl-terminal hydrolase family protein [Hondaea fermentalgiana]|eukprot:GBG32735.1 Ubiquitin carboxyl-terminal hydrolase family protein [Hondaea fermentalgiana]
MLSTRIRLKDCGVQFRGNDVNKVWDTHCGNAVENKLQAEQEGLKITFAEAAKAKMRTVLVQLSLMEKVALSESGRVLRVSYERKGDNSLVIESKSKNGELEQLFRWMRKTAEDKKRLSSSSYFKAARPLKENVDITKSHAGQGTPQRTSDVASTPPSLSLTSPKPAPKLPREDNVMTTPQRSSKLATVGERKQQSAKKGGTSPLFPSGYSIRAGSGKRLLAPSPPSGPNKTRVPFGDDQLSPRVMSAGSIGGLKNTGNSCYANAVLQVLVRLETFMQDVFAASAKRAPATSPIAVDSAGASAGAGAGASAGASADANAAQVLPPPQAMLCVAKLQALHKYVARGTSALKLGETSTDRGLTEYNARDVQVAVANCDQLGSSNVKRFYSTEQQDAHEFLAYLLDTIELAAGAVVARNFQSVMAGTLSCLHCEYKSKSSESFLHLSLDLPETPQASSPGLQGSAVMEKERTKVGTLIENYLREVPLEGFRCGKCGNEGATKRTAVKEMSRYLALHLKRFSATGAKSKSHVAPQRVLMVQGRRYELRGVVLHRGTNVNYGHYTAATYDPNSKRWTRFDDLNVERGIPHKEFADDSRTLENAYLLFYELSCQTASVAKEVPVVVDLYEEEVAAPASKDASTSNTRDQQVEMVDVASLGEKNVESAEAESCRLTSKVLQATSEEDTFPKVNSHQDASQEGGEMAEDGNVSKTETDGVSESSETGKVTSETTKATDDVKRAAHDVKKALKEVEKATKDSDTANPAQQKESHREDVVEAPEDSPAAAEVANGKTAVEKNKAEDVAGTSQSVAVGKEEVLGSEKSAGDRPAKMVVNSGVAPMDTGLEQQSYANKDTADTADTAALPLDSVLPRAKQEDLSTEKHGTDADKEVEERDQLNETNETESAK